MKEIAGTARNLMFSVDQAGHVIPMVEVILVVSEPVFRPDGGGGLARLRESETIRFSTSADGLRAVARDFGAWADEIEGAADALGNLAEKTMMDAKPEGETPCDTSSR